MASKELLSGLGKLGSKYNSLSSLNSRKLPSIPEENESYDTSLNYPSSTLDRLENEDCEDRFSRITFCNETYVEVIDPEIIEHFMNKQLNNDINGMIDQTKNFKYIGKENKLYRKPLHKKVDDVSSLLGAEAVVRPIIQKSLLDDVIVKNASKSEGILPNQVTKTTDETKQKIQPSYSFKSNIYSDIMSGKNSDRNSDEDYSWAWVEDEIKNRIGKKKTKTSKLNNHLSLNYLNEIETEIPTIKSGEFQKIKDTYINTLTSLQVSKNQVKLSEPRYLEEICKKVQDKDFIKGHISLKDTVLELESRLTDLKVKIESLLSKKSPYSYGDIKMPKFGKKDSFQTESVKLFPIVSSDEDISIKDLFSCVSEWAENEGLSEAALKRAIFSRLRGPRAKSWITYQKQPIKEAITSMIMLYDKHDSPMKYSNLIKDFKKLPNEDIQNSIGRLCHAIDKYLEFRPSSEQKVIRREILLSKLSHLLSPRGYSEVFRKLEETKQLGSELSEKEILSLIYTEDMFDKRSNMDSYLQINNINKDNDNLGSLCDEFESLELSAIEHKRKPGDALDTPIFRNRPDFKQAKTTSEPSLYRKVLEAKRNIPNYSNNKPIMVGRDNRSYVKIGNPNPHNRWHNRDNYEQSNYPRYNDRKEFISSRNAPLQVQENTRYRSNDAEFNRYDQRNKFNNSSSYNNRSERQRTFSYPNNFRSNYSSNYRPQRNSYGPNKSSYSYGGGGGLRHNMQIKSNPPAIFQQISYDQLNSLCIECPRDSKSHTMAQCPSMKVFRKAQNPDQKR